MGMLALAAAVGSASMVFGAGTASAATPFFCTGQVFLAQGVGSGSQLYAGRFGAGAINFARVGPVAPDTYNAIGYNTADNYIYGIRSENGGLWRIDATGAVTGLGRPTGLPAPGSIVAGVRLGGYNVGGFDDQGRLYVTASSVPRLWAIDVATHAVVDTVTLSEALGSADIVYAHGFFWGARQNGSVVRTDPATGAVQSFPGVVPSGTYGGVFLYGNGDLGLYDNTGFLRRVAVTNPDSGSPTFSLVSTQRGPSSTSNDATSCIAPPADLSIVKAGPAIVGAGDTVTYTLTVHNNGPGSSSGYSVTDELPDGLANIHTDTAGCDVTGRTLSCTGGALDAGDDAVITVTGVADGSVQQLANTATVRGNDPDPNPCNDTSNQVVTLVIVCGCRP